MSSSITPSWTDTPTVVAACQTLTRGNSLRATFDLRTKLAGRLHCGLGRGDTATLTVPGVYVIVRALPGNGALRNIQPYVHFNTTAPSTAAIKKLVNNGANYGAGVTAMVIDGTGTPILDDWFFLWGATAVGNNGDAKATGEWCRVASWVSGTNTINWDAPTLFAHNDNEIMCNRADMGVFELPGGSLYESIFDYVSHAAGDAAAVGAWLQTYDSNTVA